MTIAAPPPVAFSPLLRRYTLEEFWALPDPEGRVHYELIGGALSLRAGPPHNRSADWSACALRPPELDATLQTWRRSRWNPEIMAVATPPPVAFSPLLRRYTLEEFWSLPDPAGRAHYELIGGALFMVPPPDAPHDDLDARLNGLLMAFLLGHGMPGGVYHPRAAIYVGDTYLEPDMMYVSHALAARMGSRRTSADIVFEYLSRSTATYVRTTKADTYLALGVRELWLTDPETVTIEVRHAVAGPTGPAWEIRRYARGEWAESRVLAGWRVSVDELFAGLV